MSPEFERARPLFEETQRLLRSLADPKQVAEAIASGTIARPSLPDILKVYGIDKSGSREALSAALQDIENACLNSPHRDAGTWDANLARLIHHHARLLTAR